MNYRDRKYEPLEGHVGPIMYLTRYELEKVLYDAYLPNTNIRLDTIIDEGSRSRVVAFPDNAPHRDVELRLREGEQLVVAVTGTIGRQDYFGGVWVK